MPLKWLTSIGIIIAIIEKYSVVGADDATERNAQAYYDILESQIPGSDLDENDKTPKQQINFDTVAAASICSSKVEAIKLRLDISTLVFGKQMVMTKTAVSEFERNLLSANFDEKMRAAIFMSRVKIINDNPSKRFMDLKITKSVDKEEDKIIFGTGDKLNILAVTGDAKMVRGSDGQGIQFNYIDKTALPQLQGVITNYPNGVKAYVVDPIAWDKTQK
jgi:hypothetical protein